MTILALEFPQVKFENIFHDADELVASLLPTINGRGLTGAEFARIISAERRAVNAYRRDVPDAGATELARLGQIAATDCLRAVLRDRPAASGITMIVVDAPCCDSLEDFPCLGCSSHLADVTQEFLSSDPDEEESDPELWGPEWDQYTWELTEPADEPTLTLAGLIESEAAVLRARGLGAYDLMAGALTELARVVKVVSADRPDQVAERLSILEGYTEHALARDWEMPAPELNSAGVWA